MNKVNLCGRITRDIELKTTQSGKKYIQFTIACDNGKDKEGNKLEADFVNCVAWERRAEVIAEYVKKGDRFLVAGQFKTDKYETDSGENRYRSYVLVREYEFIESKKDGFVPTEPNDLNYENEENNTEVEENDPFKDFGETVVISDDDLPF